MLANHEPTASGFDTRLVTLSSPQSFEADQFRRLRHRIEDLAATRNARVIAVTSAAASDGKTLTSINLAGALAKGSRVLLIDADLRHPSVASALNIPAGTDGLVAAARAPRPSLAKYARTIDGSTLDVLPCEMPQEDPYEFLTSPAFAALLAEARERYRLVIVDTAPVLPVPDTGLLHKLVDGYVVVVSANGTPRKLLAETLNLLPSSSVLGLVFNRDDYPLFGYYQSGYRNYFHMYARSLDRPGA